MFIENKNIMENIVETLFAKDNSKPEGECKTCKNKVNPLQSGIIWFSIWVLIMSVYGHVTLFKKLFDFIF
jgi:hypothetical protein